MLQFVCECDVVKDTGKEEYLRPFIHIGLDWIGFLKAICENWSNDSVPGLVVCRRSVAER